MEPLSALVNNYESDQRSPMKNLTVFIHAIFIGIWLLSVQSNGSPDDSGFYFVQITDSHWGKGDNLMRIKNSIEKINNLSLPIEFVVHTGDITDGAATDRSIVDSGLAIMRTCKYKVLYVPGNHDILGMPFSETSAAFTRNFGRLCSRSEVRNVSIITLFNFFVRDSSGSALYNPISKLDSLLQGKPGNMPAIIFQHGPMVDDFYDNKFHPGWPWGDRMKFQQLCEKNNVVAIIAGHFHRDELHWIGGIPLFISSPIAGNWGRQSSFRVYHWAGGKLSYFSQYY
jgi:Icc-related predicted phosphoesterase